MSIELQSLRKQFDNYVALHPTSLTIQQGEMIALLGPSGSGKTTLLRLIAGLETADQGQVIIKQKDVTKVPVRERNIGFVFQHYALFKHMTVLDNVAFGLSVLPRKNRPNKVEQRKHAQLLLEMVQLGHLANRYPASLSGGQQQRVALARALATEPAVVLFDEPFGALDVKVRQDLRLWLKELQQQLGFTGIFVTHDQEEALDLADRICVMSAGKILQTATPTALYDQPKNAEVFRFMSDTHEWPVAVHGQRLDLDGGNNNVWIKTDKSISEDRGYLAIRNQELALADSPQVNMQLPVVIKQIDMLGTQYRLTLLTEGWNGQEDWHILLPLQGLAGHLPEIGKRYYLKPSQAYFLGESNQAVALIYDKATANNKLPLMFYAKEEFNI